MLNQSKETVKFEYTNTCTCQDYDDDTDEYIDSNYCFGDCWDQTLEDFDQITSDLFDKNETGWWKVSNLLLWNGEVGGYFPATNVKELINGMTVRSEWIMTGEVFDDRIEYSLSHHDAPMGSATTLRAVTEEEREELGLY